MNSLLLILFLGTSLVLAEVAFAYPALDEILNDEENEIMDVFADEVNLDPTVHLLRIPKTKRAFQLSELAGHSGQSVNRMRHFDGMLLQNLENNHSENSTRLLKKFKLILQIGTFRLRLDRCGRPSLIAPKHSDYSSII